MRRPPVSRRAPISTRAPHLRVQAFQNIGRGQRAHLGGFVHGIADAQRLHGRDEAPLELAGDPPVDDEALGGDAGLAVVDGARLHGGRTARSEIGAGHHDEGIAAAQLEHASS